MLAGKLTYIVGTFDTKSEELLFVRDLFYGPAMTSAHDDMRLYEAESPDDATLKAVAALELSRDDPLILCDADEVILHFLDPVDNWFVEQGFERDRETARITGSLKEASTGRVLDQSEVTAALHHFFEFGMNTQPAVEGALEGLGHLSDHAQVVILTKLPSRFQQTRIDHLAGLGFDYPVIASDAPKGVLAKQLSVKAGRPTLFIDDLPPNHMSVAEHLPESYRIQFVADRTINKIMPTLDVTHYRAQSWADICDEARRVLDGKL